jgi:hypothetical protein
LKDNRGKKGQKVFRVPDSWLKAAPVPAMLWSHRSLSESGRGRGPAQPHRSGIRHLRGLLKEVPKIRGFTHCTRLDYMYCTVHTRALVPLVVSASLHAPGATAFGVVFGPSNYLYECSSRPLFYVLILTTTNITTNTIQHLVTPTLRPPRKLIIRHYL